MSFSRNHSIIQYDYFIYNMVLQRIYQVEDLGFNYTTIVSFTSHINRRVGKAL
jgi:hypothetical protein